MKVERAKQWLEFALDDLEMAEILKREGKLKGAMYHIQQSYGKSKAFKTHHIDRLIKILKDNGLNIPEFLYKAEDLTIYAFTTRYPDDYVPVSADKYEEAYDIALKVYEWAKGIIEGTALE